MNKTPFPLLVQLLCIIMYLLYKRREIYKEKNVEKK